jgi:hypothetical protein
VLERPWRSGRFVVDPILADAAGFTAAVQYVESALFGTLPGEAEQLLSEPTIEPGVRLVAIWFTGAGEDPLDPMSFVAEDTVSNQLVARRAAIDAWMRSQSLYADVVMAISESPTHTRATSWFTTDDDSRGGVAFTLDGRTLVHRHYFSIPGTSALHTTSSSLTALHEFQHAVSSYSNGAVTDLYVDSPPALNIKRGRPIPALFATYAGAGYATDPSRDSLGYPAGWQSYHGELIDPNTPAVMDNYWQAPGGRPELCQNDRITRAFILDRISAKMGK